MPGLNQLKQFNKDIQSLGDEITIRASRGEKPVRVPIPRTVEDRDDSSDFELGMPEIAAPVDNSAVDDDLSDITGISTSSSDKSEDQAPTFEAPDMSALLNPIMPDSSDDMGMPDLSMFMDSPSEEEQVQEEYVEEAPKEISIADMGLDALLSGAGFDGSEVTSFNDEPKQNDDFYDDDYYITESTPAEKLESEVEPIEEIDEIPSKPSEPLFKEPGAPLDIDALINPKKTETPVEPIKDFNSTPLVEDISFEEETPFVENSPLEEEPPVVEDTKLDFKNATFDDLDFELPEEDTEFDLTKVTAAKQKEAEVDSFGPEKATVTNVFNYYDDDDNFGFAMDDIPGLENSEETVDDVAIPEDFGNIEDSSDDIFNAESVGIDEPIDFGGDLSLDPLDLPDFDMPSDSTSSDDIGDVFASLDSSDSAKDEELLDSTDFSTSDMDFGSDDFGTEASSDSDMFSTEGMDFGSNDFETEQSSDSDMFSTEGMDFAQNDFETEASSDSDMFSTEGMDFGSNDFEAEASSDSDMFSTEGMDFGSDDFGTEASSDSDMFSTEGMDFAQNDFETEASSDSDMFSTEGMDFGSNDFETEASSDSDMFSTEGMDFGSDDFETEASSGSDMFSTEGMDFGSNDFGSESSSDIFGEGGADFSEAITDDEYNYDENSEESFGDIDLSQMNEMADADFEQPETDSKFNSDGGFDDFDGDSDFEIDGFTNVVDSTTAKPKKGPKLDEPDFEGALAGKELPPNTLSDEQYKKFLNNFKEYPLNVRIAFENFIVQDEFTDDAQFEIIEKILNKAPARQVAANLEKMMDISIPVPRDYEHRTAAEYEAYKKSIGYQLKNRIIPFALIGMILMLLGWGIFNFTKYIIVIPAQAESLYKQGYALLQADEYPQSEIKFNQAASKKMKKNWFFKYARGYREKKQYQRSSKMYENILNCFKHDKEAGLEYADMVLNDLVDYERAEDIVRRQILDYHAADEDARLLLGDIFLEWGTEREPEKLELAKDQYMNLLIEAKNKKLANLYNSRMMKYYIRTDKLSYVLPYKDMFEPKENSLEPEDWTELSGYLLQKLYGPMAPSEEYLRSKIEGLRKLLLRSVNLDSENPVAYYNIGNYYIQTNEIMNVEAALKTAITKFNDAPHLKNRDIYKYIDSYRLLGENYIKTDDILQAQESYTNGITLYTAEKESSGFKGNENVGHLFADLGDINYFSSGDYKNAEMNYQSGIDLGYDNQKIRYRMGYIQYQGKNYQSALASFIKAGEGSLKERNLLLSMGNTLSLRNDDYAAEGYYSQLIDKLNQEIIDRGGGVFPQANKVEYDLMTTYLYAANNYGVTLHRLAERTGDSSRNSDAIVQFQQSERAWDALTRNQTTMVRLGGSNLAEENLRYVTHPDSTFEPSIYVEIPKTLTENEGLN